MTLVITALAAFVASALYFKNKNFHATELRALALMYWGAALMWCVDGFANLAEGESFIELSDRAAMADDALLGIVVVALGLCVWFIWKRFLKRPQVL